MNEKLKQRLVGAIVLVSLAVIFIPMMLDGGESSSMPMFGSNIPDRPDDGFEPLEIPLKPVTTVAEERPVLIDKAEPAPKPAEKSTGSTAPVTQQASGDEPSPSKPEKAVKPASASTKPSSAAAADTEAAWVVQAGSFSQSSNALSLRDKLRAKGFTAFVEKLTSGGGTIYRVRIGPELKRDNAEKQQQRLQRVMGMKGIVMGHN